MGKVNPTALTDWQDGQIVNATDYKRERDLVVTANNDTHDRILPHKMYKKTTVSNPSATIDTFGTAVDLLPATGYLALNPLAFNVVFGGTFGAETATADITVTYSDATTVTLTKTATATGTTSLIGTDLMTLAKDGVFINKISVKSKSSIASTTATATFNHYGFYL